MENLKDKFIQVYVNGRKKPVTKTTKKLLYGIVVQMAFGSYEEHPNRLFTVTFSKGVDGASGSMVKGDSIRPQEGMIFNVTATDLS